MDTLCKYLNFFLYTCYAHQTLSVSLELFEMVKQSREIVPELLCWAYIS